MHFSLFSSLPWTFDPFLPRGGRGAVKLAPLRRRRRGERAALNEEALRRRRRGERLGRGGEARLGHIAGLRPHPRPPPSQGEGKDGQAGVSKSE